MKSSLWMIITLVSGIVGFLLGYSVSSFTGTRRGGEAAAAVHGGSSETPAQPAAGGYGGPAETPKSAAGGYGGPAETPKPAAAGGYGGPAETPKPAAGGYGAPEPPRQATPKAKPKVVPAAGY